MSLPLSDNEIRELALLRELERRGDLEPAEDGPTKQRDHKQEARLKAASSSLIEFARAYLSHYLYCDISPLHESLAARFFDVVTCPHPRRTVDAAPRGNAKTTWVSTIGPLWCLCHPDQAKKRFIVLLSDTAGQADANLEAIRDELEGNEKIRRDYGDLVGDPLKDNRTWTKSKIQTTNGIQVASYGAGKSLRGIKKGSARPDLLIADDLENDENVLTPSQRKKLLSWWTKSATKLGGPAGMDVFVVGTILHYDSLLSGLLANPGYQAKKFKAVIEWPRRRDLWDRWDAIYCDLSRPEDARKADALAFYEAHRSQMEEGAQVLWPHGDPLYSLMETLTTDGPAAFDSEKQNEPINPDDCLFQEDWFTWYTRPEERGESGDLRLPGVQHTVAAVDPSLGKRANKGDFSAIVVLGRGSDGRDYVLEASIERRSPDQIIEDTIETYRRHQCREIAVEAVAFQEFFADEMGRRGREENLHLPIVPVHPNTDKVLRISSLQPQIRSGNIVFHRAHKRLYDQLRLFPLADHDDGPDALHMAYERGQGQAAEPASVSGSSYGGGTKGARSHARETPRRGGVFGNRAPFRR